MSHKWNDFSEETPPLWPELPLSTGQMYPGVQIPSGVLPSGESNFLDPIQYQNDENLPNPENIGGSGINWPFPYPNLKTEDITGFQQPKSEVYLAWKTLIRTIFDVFDFVF